jgi:hypothetical protein
MSSSIINGMKDTAVLGVNVAANYGMGYVLGMAIKGNRQLWGQAFAVSIIASEIIDRAPDYLAKTLWKRSIVRGVLSTTFNVALLVAMRELKMIGQLATYVGASMTAYCAFKNLSTAKFLYDLDARTKELELQKQPA